MKSSQTTNSQNAPLGQQVECGLLLKTAAKALNHPTTWINVPFVLGGFAFTHHIAVWVHQVGLHLTWPVVGAIVLTAVIGGLCIQQIRAFRGPLVRRLLRRFAIQCMMQKRTFHHAVGVNNGGGAVKCAFVDEWNIAREGLRPDTFPLQGDEIDCTEVAEVDGSPKIFPDMDRVHSLHKKFDAIKSFLQPGEKPRVLLICDESRTGDTVNRLLMKLARPDIEIEVMSIIRREECKGRINWYFLESASRRLLPCRETPKIKRMPCSRKRKSKTGDAGPSESGPQSLGEVIAPII